MELMCSVVIPLIYNAKDDQESYAIDSIPAILTLIFQHVEKIEYHVWVLESFLSKKKELHKVSCYPVTLVIWIHLFSNHSRGYSQNLTLRD
ncbi:hypothetical protein AHF37_03069 [Paragonimus kellicotti]|nr:hypothetical protein AHF37_03069 [Paragonimus kellicotti]